MVSNMMFRLLMSVCLPCLMVMYFVTQHSAIQRDPWMVFRHSAMVSVVTAIAAMPVDWVRFLKWVREHWRIVIFTFVVDAVADWLRELPKYLGVPLLVSESLRQMAPLVSISWDLLFGDRKAVTREKMIIALTLVVGCILLVYGEYSEPVLAVDVFSFMTGVGCVFIFMLVRELYERISHGAQSRGFAQEFAFVTTLAMGPCGEAVYVMKRISSLHRPVSHYEAFAESMAWWLRVLGAGAFAWVVVVPSLALFKALVGQGGAPTRYFQSILAVLVALHIGWDCYVSPSRDVLKETLYAAAAVFGPPTARVLMNPFIYNYGAFGVSVLDLSIVQTAGRLAANLALAGIAIYAEGKILCWWHGVAMLCILGPGSWSLATMKLTERVKRVEQEKKKQ
eukprot:Hpha_TRINITY_DN15815_c3_g1::TRINITY_DN15815_c3_g1_i1::g.189668::m.189668